MMMGSALSKKSGKIKGPADPIKGAVISRIQAGVTTNVIRQAAAELSSPHPHAGRLTRSSDSIAGSASQQA
jgi:hypothetical protein